MSQGYIPINGFIAVTLSTFDFGINVIGNALTIVDFVGRPLINRRVVKNEWPFRPSFRRLCASFE